MKKLIYMIALVLICVSCSDDEETLKTTYQIVNNMEGDENPTIAYLDGTLWEVTVFCIDEVGDIVNEDHIQPVASGGGKSEKQEVADYVKKIVISFKFLPRESSLYDMDTNGRRYVVSRFVMTAGENNIIEIDGATNIQKTMALVHSEKELMKNAFAIIE